MQLVSIFSCSNANFSVNGSINALDLGIDRLEVDAFPSRFKLILLMRFEYFPGEIGRHEAIIKFIDSDGNVRSEQKVVIHLEQGRRYHQILADFGPLEIARADSYRFDVIVDNDYKGYWPLEVATRQQDKVRNIPPSL